MSMLKVFSALFHHNKTSTQRLWVVKTCPWFWSLNPLLRRSQIHCLLSKASKGKHNFNLCILKLTKLLHINKGRIPRLYWVWILVFFLSFIYLFFLWRKDSEFLRLIQLPPGKNSFNSIDVKTCCKPMGGRPQSSGMVQSLTSSSAFPR